MAKEVKCQQCKVKTPKDELILHIHEASTGTKKNMYFHEECYNEYLKEREFKDKELEEAKKKFDAEKDKKKKENLKKTVDTLTKDSEKIKARITEIEESIKEN